MATSRLTPRLPAVVCHKCHATIARETRHSVSYAPSFLQWRGRGHTLSAELRFFPLHIIITRLIFIDYYFFLDALYYTLDHEILASGQHGLFYRSFVLNNAHRPVMQLVIDASRDTSVNANLIHGHTITRIIRYITAPLKRWWEVAVLYTA